MPIIQPNSAVSQVYGAQGRISGNERASVQEQVKEVNEEKLEAAENALQTGNEGQIRTGETVNVLNAGVSESSRAAEADPRSPRGSFLDIVV